MRGRMFLPLVVCYYGHHIGPILEVMEPSPPSDTAALPRPESWVLSQSFASRQFKTVCFRVLVLILKVLSLNSQQPETKHYASNEYSGIRPHFLRACRSRSFWTFLLPKALINRLKLPRWTTRCWKCCITCVAAAVISMHLLDIDVSSLGPATGSCCLVNCSDPLPLWIKRRTEYSTR